MGKAILVAGLFILLDMVTGLVKAFKQKRFDSSIMREGLFNKSATIIIVGLSVLLDYGQTVLELGSHLPITIAVCTYISLMECGSIYENVCRINKSLATPKLRQFFNKLNDEDEDGDENNEK